jgi:hypothetical protein
MVKVLTLRTRYSPVTGPPELVDDVDEEEEDEEDEVDVELIPPDEVDEGGLPLLLLPDGGGCPPGSPPTPEPFPPPPSPTHPAAIAARTATGSMT